MTRPRKYVPDRGDVAWITLDPQAGHEQAGRRPALVLSPAIYNGPSGLLLACPITNRAKGYPFEVVLPDGFAVTGVVLTDQVRNLDWRVRKAVYINSLPDDIVGDVLRTLGRLLPVPD